MFEYPDYTGEYWLRVTGECTNCIFDEFRWNKMSEREFIRFIDYNRHIINVKHSDVVNNYETIIITSPDKLCDIYPFTREDRRQWERRITSIHLDDNYWSNMHENITKLIHTFYRLFHMNIFKLLN